MDAKMIFGFYIPGFVKPPCPSPSNSSPLETRDQTGLGGVLANSTSSKRRA
jgi:hypothetical protein